MVSDRVITQDVIELKILCKYILMSSVFLNNCDFSIATAAKLIPLYLARKRNLESFHPRLKRPPFVC